MKPEYSEEPYTYLPSGDKKIASFLQNTTGNLDAKTVASFGDEWQKFDSFDEADLENAGNEYFDIVTDEMLNSTSIVLDAGCGSGRWTGFIANRAGHIDAVDPSDAVFAASRLLHSKNNVRITQASIDRLPFHDQTFDFILCLGVLHHIPDTQQALNDLVKKLKPGGNILLYFYYNLENRGAFYKFLFSIVNLKRRIISSLPKGLKHFFCDVIALFVYLPLVSIARFIKFIAPKSSFYQRIPLSYYTNKSFRIMRNDALDRFGTPLEKRYSRDEIRTMMENSGLGDIHFSDNQPYWHVVGRRA